MSEEQEPYVIDRRPGPRARKNAILWQRYLHWDSLMRSRVRHILRLKAIVAGKSAMDAEYEREVIKELTKQLKEAKENMVEVAQVSVPGEVWAWTTGIRGLGVGGMAAQLIAEIDDIERFATVSKLWRYAGLAVLGGKAEGKASEHYNRSLKSLMFLIVSQFIRQGTPYYRGLYDAEKDRQRVLHPQGYQDEDGRWHYNDGHLHMRAMRVVAKEFLANLYERWHS